MRKTTDDRFVSHLPKCGPQKLRKSQKESIGTDLESIGTLR